MQKGEQVKNCFNIISTFCEINKFSDNLVKKLNSFLGDYLNRRKTPTTLQLNLMLEKLLSLSTNEVEMISIVNRTIEYGWGSFYPINNGYKSKSIDNIPKSGANGMNKQRVIVVVEEEF